jgi:hypothetical protein
MHGVRLVKTPAVNNKGSATSGRPDSVLAMFEKSITVEKAIERERDTERWALDAPVTHQPARFLLTVCRRQSTEVKQCRNLIR